jgi:hypothetical protein
MPQKVACFPIWPGNKLQLEAHIDVRNDRKKKARGKKITGLQVGTFGAPSGLPWSYILVTCIVKIFACSRQFLRNSWFLDKLSQILSDFLLFCGLVEDNTYLFSFISQLRMFLGSLIKTIRIWLVVSSACQAIPAKFW